MFYLNHVYIIHHCDAVCLDLVAEEQRPADVYRVKTAVALQHDGERYHTLSGLQGQRQVREAGFCLTFEIQLGNQDD